MLFSKINSDRACVRKQRYDEWGEAESAARALIEDIHAGKAKRYKDGYLMAYRCDFCEGWHVGHAGARCTRRAMNMAGFPVWVDYCFTGPQSVTGRMSVAAKRLVYRTWAPD